MKLASYTIINYKSAKLVRVDLRSDRVNTFIGVNDCGKSTLLQALKLFFEEKPATFFETETSKKTILSNSRLTKTEFTKYLEDCSLPNLDAYEEDLVCVFCKFTLEKKYTVEELENAGISVQMQYILSKLEVDDNLNIVRVFCADGTKNKYYILCDDYVKEENDPPAELWLQNQTTLKKIQSEAGIKDDEITNRNDAGQLKNIERIMAVYEKLATVPVWSSFDLKKDKSLFPNFRYLDWNISSEELNQLTEDIISPIISKSLQPLQKNVIDGVDEINREANAELEKLYKKYSDSLPSSISGISANVKLDLKQSVTELFVNKLTSDQKIHIDEQGDGVKRQIGLGLIKALAQESLDEKEILTKHIWCLDEPETHLFPQAQRELANSLSILAEANFQILVSTHSTLFVDRSNISDINQVLLDNYYTVLKSTSSTDDIFATLGVRNSDFLFYDRFIAVEGQTEYALMDYFYYLIYGKTLVEDGIQLINLGGSTHASTHERLLENIFKDFQKAEHITVYMFDKDTARSGDNIILIGQTADFEDELNNEVWIRLIKDSCGVTITSDEIDNMRKLISVMDKGTKLHKQLLDHVAKSEARTDWLPSKGEQLATVLKNYLVDENDVPESIKEVFNKSRSGLES